MKQQLLLCAMLLTVSTGAFASEEKKKKIEIAAREAETTDGILAVRRKRLGQTKNLKEAAKKTDEAFRKNPKLALPLLFGGFFDDDENDEAKQKILLEAKQKLTALQARSKEKEWSHKNYPEAAENYVSVSDFFDDEKEKDEVDEKKAM